MASKPLARSRLSEQNREVARSHWFGMVRRLLTFHAKSANLRLPLHWKETCAHPLVMVANGSNQYGRWTRCNACKQQLTYEPYSESNPPPSKSKSKQTKHQETFVPQPKIVPSLKAKAAKPEMTGGVSHQELSQALERQAGYLVSGFQAALGPLMQNQAQLQQALQQVMVQQQLMTGSGQSMPSDLSQMPIAPETVEPTWIGSDEDMENPNQLGWELPQ